MGRKGKRGRQAKHDLTFMRKVSREYLEGNLSLPQLAAKYNIARASLGRWVKQFSSELSEVITISAMTEEEQKDFELLKKQNESLKKKLEYEQMRNFALETMADLAKTELGIDIRKNFGAKQPKE